jgi:hypothetical protein
VRCVGVVARLTAVTTPRNGACCVGGAATAFSPHTGQHFGQNVPRWKTGWCIFSARPPQAVQAAVTIPD